MSSSTTSRHEALTSRGLFVVGLVLVMYLKLLPALLAGLLVHGLVTVLAPLVRVPTLGRAGTRILAVALLAIATIGLVSGAVAALIGVVRESSGNLPALAQRMAEILESSRGRVPAWMQAYLPADAEQLRLESVGWLRSNADAFGVAGNRLGRGLVHIVTGMVVGALVVLDATVPKEQVGPLSGALRDRARILGRAFRSVVFAQVSISAINTTLTAIYIAGVLPALGVHLPFTKTLIVVTFVAGLVPILGNLVSNTVIFVVSLSQSMGLAFASLVYLIAIHKLEYFLNAQIIGGHIRARAWELLMAMLVMEAAFGTPGLIVAPILYAYLKDELRDLKLV